MKRVVLGLVLALTGCGGGGTCPQRSGAVRVNMTVRTGDCGAMPEAVVTASKQPTAPESPCTGSITYSENNCDVTVDSTCPTNGGGSLKMTGKVTWTEDNASASGILDFTAKDATGAATCHGTYDAKYTKI